jgi:hypothetical protein
VWAVPTRRGSAPGGSRGVDRLRPARLDLLGAGQQLEADSPRPARISAIDPALCLERRAHSELQPQEIRLPYAGRRMSITSDRRQLPDSV